MGQVVPGTVSELPLPSVIASAPTLPGVGPLVPRKPIEIEASGMPSS